MLVTYSSQLAFYASALLSSSGSPVLHFPKAPHPPFYFWPLSSYLRAIERETQREEGKREEERSSPAMEKHTCKLCFRRFSNGRALGGHMRSHVTSKLQPHPPPSPSFSGSFSEEVAEVAERESPTLMEDSSQFVIYGLRENPRKSFRLVDPEFSSTFLPPDSSIVLQDRESETESSKPPSLRRRSKRRRRSPAPPLEPYFDPEPVSSVSDTTPEEDVARCLMMLSRDVWNNDSSPEKKPKNFNQLSEDYSEAELTTMAKSRRGRTKYRCETCKKVFRSYQALGGHRASHKNIRACVPPAEEEDEEEEEEKAMENQIQEVDSEVNFAPSAGDRKIHECPVCFRVFGSGQALGGHKRSHIAQSPVKAPTKKTATEAASSPPPVPKESLIDLNLPPPEEEGELSAVFDAEQ